MCKMCVLSDRDECCGSYVTILIGILANAFILAVASRVTQVSVICILATGCLKLNHCHNVKIIFL